MARRKQFAIQDIHEAAFQVVRKNGIQNLTARAIARKMKSSTMPIYSCVNSLREVEETVVRRAWKVLEAYQSRSWTADVFVDMGLGYVLFSKEEKYLFQCIHAESYEAINTRQSERNFDASVNRLLENPMFQNIPRQVAEKILFHGFLFSHGFASLLNSGMSTVVRSLNSEAAIINLFKEASAFSWKGLRSAMDWLD